MERLESELAKMRDLKESAERSVDELQRELIEAHRVSSETWALTTTISKGKEDSTLASYGAENKTNVSIIAFSF